MKKVLFFCLICLCVPFSNSQAKKFKQTGTVDLAVKFNASPFISYGYPGMTYLASTSSAAGLSIITGVAARRKNQVATLELMKTRIRVYIQEETRKKIEPILMRKFQTDPGMIHISKNDQNNVSRLKDIYPFPDGQSHSNLAYITHGNNAFILEPNHSIFLNIDSFTTFYFDSEDRGIAECEILLSYLVRKGNKKKYDIKWMDLYKCDVTGGSGDFLANNGQFARELSDKAIDLLALWIEQDLDGKYPKGSKREGKVKIPWQSFKGEILDQDTEHVALRMEDGGIRILPMVWVKKVK